MALLSKAAAWGALCLFGCTGPRPVQDRVLHPTATKNPSESVNMTERAGDRFPEGTNPSNPTPEVEVNPHRVQYVADTIMQIDGTSIDLLGGSRWELLAPSLALPLKDVCIILTSKDAGIAFIDGSEVPVVHRSGLYLAAPGLFARVVEASDDGALLRLNDGSLWSVPDYDRFDTGWWLPPYPVLVVSNGLYLINLKKGKRVWVTQLR